MRDEVKMKFREKVSNCLMIMLGQKTIGGDVTLLLVGLTI